MPPYSEFSTLDLRIGRVNIDVVEVEHVTRTFHCLRVFCAIPTRNMVLHTVFVTRKQRPLARERVRGG